MKRIANKYLRWLVVITFSILLGFDTVILIMYCRVYHITWVQWCNTISFILFLMFAIGKIQEKIKARKHKIAS